MSGNLLRVGLTGALAIGWGTVNYASNAIQTVALGHLAALQFNDSDVSAVASQAGIRSISILGGLSTLALVILLLVIWVKPITTFFTKEITQ